ncbi:MAG: trypsin-like peptidase domain-containing protein [Dehalococcoidia bacterium]|nr:trypsin-like peptidase domain-containing protein [Dehalococcoidia bacterium]
MRILLVQGMSGARGLADFLAHAGHMVDQALSPGVIAAPYDVALLDGVPVGGLSETVLRLRQAGVDAPVLVLTGEGVPDAEGVGVAEVLHKPVPLGMVLEHARRLVGSDEVPVPEWTTSSTGTAPAPRTRFLSWEQTAPPGPRAREDAGDGAAGGERRQDPPSALQWALLTGLVLLLVGLSLVVVVVAYRTSASTDSRAEVRTTGTPPAGVAAVASAAAPAVVNINTVLGFHGGQGAGTGIVLTANGEVLTNNHVIQGATTITATDVGNGRVYQAEVVGYDVAADVALLRLRDASGLRTAVVGDSEKVAVGDAVISLGNAGGLGGAPTVATGAVVALRQSITAYDTSDGSSEQLDGLIQTSVPLQPGDSGGPLLDGGGHVIGVDTAASTSGHFRLRSRSTGGFAIPINAAMAIVKEIREGRASATIHIGATAFLGVATRASMTGPGAVVSAVEPGSPAHGMGIAAGDTITALAGVTVETAATISQLLFSRHPGDRVAVSWTDSAGGQHREMVTLSSGPPH